MVLYNLADNCDYGGMKTEMIRDRLVVGIRDHALSEKMQMDPKLTLETAKKTIRQKEAVQQQQKALKGVNSKEPTCLEAVHPGANRRKRPIGRDHQRMGSQGGPSKEQKAHSSQTKQCTRCGRGQHPRDKCPAKDATCHKCQRKGHYSAHCYSKSVSTLSEESSLETAFLDTMSSKQDKAWFSSICIGDQETLFKLDTGAEVTAVSQDSWQLLGKPSLSTSDKQLFGPARNPLQVLGQFKGHLSYQGRASTQQVFVVKGLKNNLLGLPAITALNLVARVDETSTSDTTTASADRIREKFPRVFQGLGNLGEEYEIKLKPDAKPYSLCTPRHVPLPLRPKVAEELNKMEEMGVISKVIEPTPWCAGMVVVPKKSGAIRICVDLKPLNESVLREVHPLPKVDETLAQLTGAKIFSKLDANSGFWQIPLSQSSRLLTTFITPAGRYCFNKLPFGISSAPEHFQRRMSEILTGLPGVLCQMDDILIFGKDQAEHDARLEAALTRIEAAGATLNPQKCEFGKRSLKFLGHMIDETGIRADPDKTTAVTEMSAPTTVPELRRFLGMVNQLGKFTPNLAELTQPLRELLSKSNAWVWGPAQSKAFSQVKQNSQNLQPSHCMTLKHGPESLLMLPRTV